MEIQQLLFELSHPLRYQILVTLADSSKRLTELAELLKTNNPETSRHLDRLRTSALVERDSDGNYQASNLGRLVIGLLPSLSLVSRNATIFNDHDLSMLPATFKLRLGELEPCEVVEGMIKNVYRLDEISKNSSSRIFTVSNEFVSEIKDEHFAEMDKAMAGGFNFRYILQESQLEDKNLMKIADHSGSAANKRFRVISKVPLFCTICDEDTMIAFLDKTSKVDFSVSLWSKDPVVKRWCKDLLEHLWESGKYLSEYR